MKANHKLTFKSSIYYECAKIHQKQQRQQHKTDSREEANTPIEQSML